MDVGGLAGFLVTSIGKKVHRDKAKSIFSKIGYEEIPKEVLAEAGFEIFQKFESQFMSITTDQGVKRAVIKLVEDAVDRVMNYIAKDAESTGEGEKNFCSLITKGVILGESKEEMAGLIPKKIQNLHISLKPGCTVKDDSGEKWKTSEIYGRAGLVRIKGNDVRYYKKRSGSGADKYGYRLPFQWEIEKLDRGLEQEYEIDGQHSTGKKYNYILNSLTSEQIKQKLDNVLKKIKDPIDKIEEKVDEVKQIVEGNFKQISQKLGELDGRIVARQNSKQVEKPVWFEVRESVTSFTGRQGELDEIVNSIKNGIIVISGLGGVGKSELAIRYARSQYSEQDSVIWINAETRETAEGSFHRLYKELGFKIRDAEKLRDLKGLKQRQTLVKSYEQKME